MCPLVNLTWYRAGGLHWWRWLNSVQLLAFPPGTIATTNNQAIATSCPPSHPSSSPSPPPPLRSLQIVEEGPVTIAPPEVVHELEQGARRLAKIVGYCGVATVEYLYSMVHGNYYFLEVNPRLQVSCSTTLSHDLSPSSSGGNHHRR